jgi:hypothetical protein
MSFIIKISGKQYFIGFFYNILREITTLIGIILLNKATSGFIEN